jgi:hypothetical protein
MPSQSCQCCKVNGQMVMQLFGIGHGGVQLRRVPSESGCVPIQCCVKIVHTAANYLHCMPLQAPQKCCGENGSATNMGCTPVMTVPVAAWYPVASLEGTVLSQCKVVRGVLLVR